MTDDEPLVTSSVAARAVGVSVRTLQVWTKDGLVTPTKRLPSGHARWRVSDLESQISKITDG